MPLNDVEVQLHNHGIGASMIGAILGVNPFSGPIDAWLHLTGRAKRETTEDGQRRQGWGHQMEEMLAAWYEEATGADVTPCQTLVHPAHAWVIATPDRIVEGADVLVECKHVGERVAWHWHDGVPDYVRAQCAWQMLVCRALGMPIERVDVVADIGGAPPAIFPVGHDAELEQMMFEAAESFWRDHVLADVAPAVDGSASYQAWLRRQFPGSNGTMREAPEAEPWARQYAEAKATIASATAAADLAANQLRAIIGGDDGVTGAWGRVTNRTSASGSRTLRVALAGLTRSRGRGRAIDLGGIDA